MLQFEVEELDRRDLPLAWPLVRAVAPELGLDNWKAFGQSLLERGGGVIAVSAEESGYLGVATYEPTDKRHFGKVLQVDVFTTFELTRRAPVRHVLCEAVDRMAPRLGCAAVAISFPSRSYLAHAQKKPVA